MSRIRFRLYLGGDLIKDETREVVDPSELSPISEEHASTLLGLAQMTGKRWLVEAEILDDPTDPERFLRFGTDADGMVDPRSVHPRSGHPWA